MPVTTASRVRSFVALAVLSIASGQPAHAETERYAVVIGHNSGATDEQPLRFAESDAQRFADLLSEIGGVPAENQVVLRRSAGRAALGGRTSVTRHGKAAARGDPAARAPRLAPAAGGSEPAALTLPSGA
jgi:hypothetical protein